MQGKKGEKEDSGQNTTGKTMLKVTGITLAALLAAILLNRFVYSAFVMSKLGYAVWYDLELWKQYWAFLPGKILCIVNIVLIASLIIEFIWFAGKYKK